MNLDDNKIKIVCQRIQYDINYPIMKIKQLQSDQLKDFTVIKSVPEKVILIALNQDRARGNLAIGCLLGLFLMDKVINKKFSYVTSLCLCISESFFCVKNLEIRDFIFRLVYWWYYSYCNLSDDNSSTTNNLIIMNIEKFIKEKIFFLPKYDNLIIISNESLLLVPPIAIFTKDYPEWGITMAQIQSYISQHHILPSLCCATLVYVLNRFINNDINNKQKKNPNSAKILLTNILAEWEQIFISQITYPENITVHEDEQQNAIDIIKQICKSEPDSNKLDSIWNWKLDIKEYKNKSIVSNQCRKFNINYNDLVSYKIGYYSPDALSIIFHILANYTINELVSNINIELYHENVYILAGSILGGYYGYQNIMVNDTFSKLINNLQNTKSTNYKRLLITSCLLYLIAQ